MSLVQEPVSGAVAGEREVVIRPASSRLDPWATLQELYQYRHLLRALVWRNVRVQFDALHLGFVWAFARPVLYLFVFVAIRNLSGANTGVEIVYPLYLYSGLVLWYYFLDAVMSTARSLQQDAGLLTKVYYPRLITPLVPTLASLANLSIALIPMLPLMAWYNVYPDWRIILLPAVMLQCVALVLGLGMVFATISLTNRDWDRFLQFSLFLGLFISPVIYAPDMIPENVRTVYLLNPMAGTLLAFRSVFFADFSFPLWQWGYSLVFSIGVLIAGLWLFGRAEAELADKL